MSPDPSFASEKPLVDPPTVDDVKVVSPRGPWKTKAGGNLSVLFAFTPPQWSTFYHYDDHELQKIPEDIRGFRSYCNRNIPSEKVGGTEFHRIRRELIIGLEGLLEWESEDVFGKKRQFTMSEGHGLLLPPFIFHAYHTNSPSGLLVICNTLFDPDNRLTQDTYSRETFHQLQQAYRKS